MVAWSYSFHLLIYLFPLFSQGYPCRFRLFHVSYIFLNFVVILYTDDGSQELSPKRLDFVEFGSVVK